MAQNIKSNLLRLLDQLPITSNWIAQRRTAQTYQAALERIRKKTPVYVYQMGKVASTSVYKSLKKYYDGEVYHGHTFESTHYKAGVRALYQYFRQDQGSIKIISLVREPIGRNISSFFHNFKRSTGVEFEDHTFSMEELKDIFLSDFPHHVPLEWFDEHIKEHFDIDVYEYPFPSLGHITMKKGNIELLLMKHDLKDSIKEEVIKEFMSLGEFAISNENVGAEKNYSDTYKQFKKLSLPNWYFEQMQTSKYMRHFYSEEEIEKIKRKWKFSDKN